MKGISVVRRLVNSRNFTQIKIAASSINTKTLASPISSPQSSSKNNNLANPNVSFHSPQLFNRNFCSGPSNFVVVESEEQFNSSMRDVKDNSQPAIYYFTAVWCAPCKILSPLLDMLCEKYPSVTTYKVDIDHEELGTVLSKLDINTVPALYFFKNGEKAYEVVGFDVARIRSAMAMLYK